ncbi:LemA family protein [Patescibacteria group bacterium]|nr:MAG: LemA family protein [Patescibacteria group bacterium]
MPYLIWIPALVVVALLAWLILSYNGLIQGRNRVDEAWSDIEVQMKRRYDLIPNLVETVKAYAKHEDSVFTKVTQARSAAMNAKTPAEHAQAENMLTGTLKSLFAVAEAYPALQAAGNFLDLQQNLTDAEDKIQSARRFFNGNARDYNTSLQSFPTNLIASAFGFRKREFYDAPDVAMETPAVKF